MDRLATMLTEVFEEMFDQKADEVAEKVIDQFLKKGGRAPTPSRAYIEESHVRAALGRRASSPMAPQTFVTEYLKSGTLTRVPDTITGNKKTKFVYWKDVEKILSEKKADIIRRHIITG